MPIENIVFLAIALSALALFALTLVFGEKQPKG